MITIQGQPVTDVEIWGWPWHGQLQEGGNHYRLRRHDGSLWPLYGDDPNKPFLPDSLLSRMTNYAGSVNGSDSFSGDGATTHLVRVHGHEFTPRTVEQLVVDQAQSQEWRGETMLCGVNHLLYMTSLGWYHWIYSHNGQRWQMRITVTSAPHPLSNPSAALSLAVEARPFGVFDQPGAWETCGTVTAASCCTPGFGWFTPGITLATQPPVLLQSVRSDGGQLILEMRFWAMEPSRMSSAPVGFYRLDISHAGGWVLDLVRLKKDAEVYTKALTQNSLTQSGYSLTLEATTNTPDLVIYEYQYDPSGTGTPFLTAVGTIEQQQTRHCGFVFDADDALHELACRITASHACNVAKHTPTFSGSEVRVYEAGDLVSVTSDLRVELAFTNTVTTTLLVEILRDGVAVSSASAELHTSREVHFDDNRSAGVAPSPCTYRRRGTLTVGSHTASYDVTDSFNGAPPGGDVFNWPDAGLFGGSFFSSRSGLTLTPWPASTRPGAVIEQPLEWRTFSPGGGAVITNGFRIRLGAARLANNVFVPVIVAGLPVSGILNRWNQLADGWGFTPITGMPASIFGPRVGPDSNGDTPPAVVPVAGVGPLKIENGAYDFLHRVVLPYGDIF